MNGTVAIVNQKGGVGKTTVTLGIASAAWAAQRRVLVVDTDAQASATWALGLDPATVEFGTSEAIAANKSGVAKEGIVASNWEGVDILPASGALLQREVEVGIRGASTRLRRALEGVTDEYSLVLIDCPPTIGLTTVTALTAARFVLLVVEPAALSLRGIEAVSDCIDGVWAQHNPELDIAGAVINRVPPVSSEADRQVELLSKMLGRKTIWEPPVPTRQIVAHALAQRMPVHSFGARAADVAGVFDHYESRLRRLIRR